MAEIKIKHVEWRDGRPRFRPGKAMQDAGYKSQDLKHANGTWYSQGEALDWSNKLVVELTARKAESELAASSVALPVVTPPIAMPRAQVYPVSKLFEDWLKSPRVLTKAPNTIKDYKQKSRVLENWDPDLWACEVSSLDQIICYGLYEDLWQAKGIATARGAMVVFGMAIKWGMRSGRIKGMTMNPARDLDMMQPKPRARFLTRQEFETMIETAEAAPFFRKDFADMLFCGVWTGQRQADRLELQQSAFRAGRFVLRQNKTGAIVNPPVAPAYQARLDAAAERRKEKGIISPFTHLNESTWAPWNNYTYRNLFSEIRAAAAVKLPSLKTCMEKDMRATAVTWMALAENTLPQICAVSGHSLQGAHQILKHYLHLHPEMASTAIGKMVTWYDEGGKTDLAV
ncbi:tyrosine-type recombinase/integrase [Rhizobium panacihumi]|uniref:tyrosine-type recombinase/integrase n=1 Tax=Rhizobium panacihumi TaxID=2008450 RepID=UPI003D7906DB